MSDTKKDRLTAGAALKAAFPGWVASITTVPTPVSVARLPDRVAGPETIRKLTGKPEVADAVTENGGSPNALEVMGKKLISWLGFPLKAVTTKLCNTGVAALKKAFPGCEASVTTAPTPVRVTRLPNKLAGPDTIRKPTVKLEVALAESVKGGSP